LRKYNHKERVLKSKKAKAKDNNNSNKLSLLFNFHLSQKVKSRKYNPNKLKSNLNQKSHLSKLFLKGKKALKPLLKIHHTKLKIIKVRLNKVINNPKENNQLLSRIMYLIRRKVKTENNQTLF
jgi:hypothetical protein